MSVNNTAVFTTAIHDLDYFEYTLPTIERYAEKVGADFVKVDKVTVNFFDLHYEKYHLIEILKKYERVLYMDADIIVTPHARNVFELFPDKEKVYAYDENGEGLMDRNPFVENLLTEDIGWPIKDGKYQYFNSGVMLMSHLHKDILHDYKSIPIDRTMGLSSQTLMNYFVVKNKVPFEDIGYEFNRINACKDDKECSRYKADFIHYAGVDVYSNGNKIETIRNDYNHFYKN